MPRLDTKIISICQTLAIIGTTWAVLYQTDYFENYKIMKSLESLDAVILVFSSLAILFTTLASFSLSGRISAGFSIFGALLIGSVNTIVTKQIYDGVKTKYGLPNGQIVTVDEMWHDHGYWFGWVGFIFGICCGVIKYWSRSEAIEYDESEYEN